MKVYTFNPLEDPRWPEFIDGHARASIFHTQGWLGALRRTYGYEPIVCTTSPPTERLTNGIVFCLIRSWLTGCRMVSLPFADHCEPLVEREEDRKELLGFLKFVLEKDKLKYVELRPLRSDLVSEAGLEKAGSFYFHILDLRPPLALLFQNLHKDSIQRKIKRAEREALRYEAGRSETLLAQFYSLFLMTRRRHSLPPQPIDWFRNLIALLGDGLTIHVAYQRQQPIASILTLRHHGTLVYKYGCSNASYHSLGGMPLLFWKAIEWGKEHGIQAFDLGRSDCANPGLITFKDRWGAARSTLAYGRICTRRRDAGEAYGMQLVKRAFARMPDSLLTVAGRLLYRHVG